MIVSYIGITKSEFFEKLRYKSVNQLKSIRKKMSHGNSLKPWINELIKTYQERYFSNYQFRPKFRYPKVRWQN